MGTVLSAARKAVVKCSQLESEHNDQQIVPRTRVTSVIIALAATNKHRLSIASIASIATFLFPVQTEENADVSTQIEEYAVVPTEAEAEEQSPPFSTFTLFSNLPTELRSMILDEALPGARLIRWSDFAGQPPSSPTSLLRASRETREHALRHFVPLLDPGGIPLYINPKIDILFADHPDFFDQWRYYGMNVDLLQQLQHIAYPLSALEDLIHDQNYMIRTRHGPRNFTMRMAKHYIEEVVKFKALKTLTLIDPIIHDNCENPKAKLIDLFTKPILQWPHRGGGRHFTDEERQQLRKTGLPFWAYTPFGMEELQMALQDTLLSFDLTTGAEAASFDIKIEHRILQTPDTSRAWELEEDLVKRILSRKPWSQRHGA